MNAREYYKKYHVRLVDPKTRYDAANDMVSEMILECKELVNQGKSTFTISINMNAKFNAVCNMFYPPVLNKDAFKEIIDKRLTTYYVEKRKAKDA